MQYFNELKIKLFLVLILADIYDEVDATLEQYGIVCECVGGGIISHDPTHKTLEVYGRSQVRNQSSIE